MIITTTNNVPGREIIEYKGLATGEVVAGINFVKDIKAGFRNVFGGRSAEYQEEIINARSQVLEEIRSNASKLGANAIIGLSITIGAPAVGGMICVVAVGTAVVVR